MEKEIIVKLHKNFDDCAHNENNVEFWFILAPTTTARIPTMNGFIEQSIAVDYHQIETACVAEYLDVEKDYPYLNMQESGRKWIDTGLLEGYPGIIDTGK